MTIVSRFMIGIFVACFSSVNNVIFSSKPQNVCKYMYINNADTTLMFFIASSIMLYMIVDDRYIFPIS